LTHGSSAPEIVLTRATSLNFYGVRSEVFYGQKADNRQESKKGRDWKSSPSKYTFRPDKALFGAHQLPSRIASGIRKLIQNFVSGAGFERGSETGSGFRLQQMAG
jgi:hypothetical protein